MQDNTKDLAVAYWKKGKDAAEQSDWKSAIEMFKQSVVLSPHSVHTRRALRDAQMNAVGDRELSKLDAAKLLTIKTKLGIFRAQGKWDEVERLAEDALLIDPRDADMNATAASAWKELGWTKLAVFGYETALKRGPKNKRILAASAEMYEEQQQVLKAKGLWERLLAVDPGNDNVQRRVTALEAKGFMEQKQAGQDSQQVQSLDVGPAIEPVHLKPCPPPPHVNGAGSKPQLKRSAARAAAGASVTSDSSNEQPERSTQPKVSGTDADPNQMALLAIADNYILQGNLKEGAAVLNAALEISGGDPHVHELLNIVQQGYTEQKISH